MFKEIHHAGLIVSDVERSVLFYSENFDLKETFRVEMSGEHFARAVDVPDARILLVMLGSTSTVLELIQYLDHPGKITPPRNNDIGAGHICFSVTDMDEACARLRANGVEFISEPSPPVEGAGTRFVYLRDPDGITVEVLQVAPGVTLHDLLLDD